LSRLVALALALLVVAFTLDARAHAGRTAYLDVTAIDDVEAITSLRSESASTLTLTSPDCTLETAPRAARSQSVTVARLRCPRGLGGATLLVEGMVEGSDVVVARVVRADGEAVGSVLTARAPRLVVPVTSSSRSGRAVFSRYVTLGVEHVVSGLDHILFLLALVWQAHTASRGVLRPWIIELARAATAFTLAHMVTLTATALGWLHVSSNIAEIMIAVSLVLVALDVGRDPTDAAPPRRLGVVMAFGLVHGLGFASALTEARLPDNALALGLFGFNVGVELGQLLLLGAAVLVVSLLPARARLATLSAYAIGATGAYLVLARSTFLLR
jgi:hypothetical protein